MQLPRLDEKHPIVAGLIALVSVTLVVGLVLGVVAAVSAHVFGAGGGATNSASAGQTLYLPTPSPTPTPDGPLVTLAPSSDTPTTVPSQGPSNTAPAAPSKSPSAKTHQITLSAGETSVAPMQQINLTGVYPGGEGAILQVQRQLGGKWQDFLSVDAAVSGGQFSTYVQTGQVGMQKFRMRDTTSGMLSNVVSVKVG